MSLPSAPKCSAVRRFAALFAALFGVLFAAAASLLSARAAAAQTRDAAVRVVVVDSARRPVAGAEVTIVRDLNRVLGRGVTDDAGMRTVTVPFESGEYQVVARKIGFARGDRFFAFADSSRSTSVRVVLYPAAQQLPTVAVTAAEDLKRKSYHVDADEIMNSKRPIFDAFDILTKLRPDMLFGRMGPKMASASQPPCIVSDVWVNGRRVIYPPISAMDEARRPRGRNPMALIPIDVPATLRTIHPEHIAEVNYADCFDTSVEKPHAQNAVFVVLKPGVDFEPGRGSFVVERSSAADASPSAAMTAYRHRLLGVFDEETGEPVEGAAVTDSASGTWARSSATGTVSLAFLPEGASRVTVSRAGFADTSFAVAISPRDSVPITIVLSRRRPKP